MNRRRFVQTSLAAAVAASLPTSQSMAAILSGSMGVDADINAVTGDGAEVTLQRAAVKELGDSLRGIDIRIDTHGATQDCGIHLDKSVCLAVGEGTNAISSPDVQK